MARGGSSGRKRGTARLVTAFAILAALTVLPGSTTSLPPAPALAGPDTGWTNTPTVFKATKLPESGAGLYFDWGESPHPEEILALTWTSLATRHAHVYAEPGTYIAKCQVQYISGSFSWRYGDWSNPCTVHVVAETLMHPDSIYATVQLNHTPTWSCVLPNGNAVYVTSVDDSSVYVLDPGTNSVTESIRVQSAPNCCIAAAAGDRVYVGNHGSNSISVIRTSDDSVVDAIRLPGAPDGLALLPGDTLLYVSHKAKNQVSVVRLGEDSIIAHIAVSDSPCAMACTPDGQHVYVACLRNNRLAVISTLDHTVKKTFQVGDRPTSILFNPSGETAYVACEYAQQVELYRCSDFTKIDSISVDAQYLLMLPGNRCLYDVSEHGMDSSTVSVLRRSDNFILRQFRLSTAGVPSVWRDGYSLYAPTASVLSRNDNLVLSQFQLSTAGGPSALPDGSRLYVPHGNVVTVLGPGSK